MWLSSSSHKALVHFWQSDCQIFLRIQTVFVALFMRAVWHEQFLLLHCDNLNNICDYLKKIWFIILSTQTKWSSSLQNFKHTLQVSSDVWRVHCVPGGEPVVLFQRGAVRLLDSLLSAPQQPIEEVLAQEEAVRLVIGLTTPEKSSILWSVWD